MVQCLHRIALIAALVCSVTDHLTAQAVDNFRFTTDDRFSARSIPAYTGHHEAVYAHIDGHLDEHIANIQRWLRQPSISAQNVGIHEMAELVRQDLAGLGFSETQLISTDGHPGVWGYYDAGAERTLMVYMMYDVQPVNPDDWESPPFEARLVDNELGQVVMDPNGPFSTPWHPSSPSRVRCP